MLNPLKTELSQFFQLSKDALHVHLGLVAFLVAMVLLRRGPSSVIPWLAVLVLELLNEVLDFIRWHNTAGFMLAESFKDVLNTMFWPTVVLVLARFTPLRWR